MPGILSHAEAYMVCPDTELVALADIDENALYRAGHFWGVRRLYLDAATLFREVKPLIVSICTPDSTHAEMVRLALGAGVPAILCEKPLATCVDEAITLVRLANERGAVLAVNYSRRYDPMHHQVRAHILGGGLGVIRHVAGWYTKGIVHNGTHLLDTLRFLCGEIAEVEGFNPRPGPAGDSTPDALLYFSGGFPGWIHGCNAEDFTIFEIDLLGSSGRIRLVDQGHSLEYLSVGKSKYYLGYRELLPQPFAPAVGLRDALLHAVQDTVRALRTGSQPLCTAEDAVRVLELAQKIARQAEQSRPGGPGALRRRW